MEKILNKITFSRITVLGIWNDDVNRVVCLEVVKKKSTVSIHDVIHIENLHDFSYKTSNPIVIVVLGKGVLNKTLNRDEERDSIWYKNINQNDIYFTSIIQDKTTFISFCRKNIIHQLLDNVVQLKSNIIEIYCGALMGTLLSNEIAENPIVSDNLSLKTENGLLSEISRYEGASKSYSLGNQEIKSDMIPLFGAALAYWTKHSDIEKSPENLPAITDLKYKKIFNISGATILITFLVLLSTSFFSINYFAKENSRITLENTFSSRTNTELSELKKHRDEKLDLLKHTGAFSKKYLTSYAYDILYSVPKFVELESLCVIPLEGEIRATKEIILNPQVVYVTGKTTNQSSIDQFATNIKKLNWQRKIEILKVEKNREEVTSFELKITFKDV